MSLNQFAETNVSVHDIADFFLLQVDQNAGDCISNLKLQKLCYYAQAWHLALFDTSLFCERIEAWAHGPVIPSLYHRFKSYKWGAITPSDVITDPYSVFTRQQIKHVSDVWDKYGGMSGTTLERLTHLEGPWKKAYGNTPRGGSCNQEITRESMTTYYRGLLAANGKNTTS